MNVEQLIASHPADPPHTSLIWTALIDIAPTIDLGSGPLGHRFMVPILGGQFFAGPSIEGLEGKVLSGGADRQLLRADGVKELDALYEMQTDDGTIITVHNRVIIDPGRKPEPYVKSVISARAPTGRFDWLNRRILVGTLQPAAPERDAVIIRAWQVDG